MVAAYIREKFPGPLSDTVCMLADVADRGQEYRTGKVKDNGLWLWAIVRAWWKGVKGGRLWRIGVVGDCLGTS